MAEQRIGKYRILERIGRGGMGMIFKAHDPILDRQVALKVIAPEVEVTDEMRARFFREAQACAKLNHPNIVTVYDMGEDEARLYIVMELLEGQELRRFITPQTALTLEEKLSVMVQACSGLHYAHQKGVVHRDIKPGNIFLLRNGQVKILDFGIAHMATTEGLTRTGLIMGTLRYISPEQVRGRSDHRSDMFSLGSVCYELLSQRPPFSGDDPMHLLEQLRTEDPPPLDEVDPRIPAELSVIVQRAMRKDPSERFRDLDEMRGELEQVQRTIVEEWQRASARVRAQRERVLRLQATLDERLGRTAQGLEVPGIDQRKGLVGIQALEHELEGRIAALEAEVADAEAQSPALKRAQALLEAGRFEEALAEFETIVAEVPDLRRAREGLERARQEAEAQRRRQRGVELTERARAALKERRYAECVEIVQESADLSLPADIAQELASLRDRAVAEQEALRRVWQEAEAAAKRSAAARANAETEEAPQHAPGKWNEAQALSGAGEASLRRGAYGEAKEAFERAAAMYADAVEAARQAQVEERRTAERAREGATLGQQQARAAGSEQYAAELWDAGEKRFAEAQAAFTKKAPGRGAAAFRETAALYRQAEEAARGARDRERRRAEAARERNAEGRRGSEELDAERLAPSIWQDAVARTAAGEAAWMRGEYARATEVFEAALQFHHQAQSQIREIARRQREVSVRKQQEVAAGRRAASTVEAAADAAAEWATAEECAAAAGAAFDRNAWEEAAAGFDRALELYRTAEARAREIQQARGDADRAQHTSGLQRASAAGADAATYAPELWNAAVNVETRAATALSQQRYASARALFGESERLFGDARAAAVAEVENRRAAVPPPAPVSEPTSRARVESLDDTVVRPMTFPGGTRPIDPDATIVDRTPLPTLDTTVLAQPPRAPRDADVAVPPGGGDRVLPKAPRKLPSLRTILIGGGAVAAAIVALIVARQRPTDSTPAGQTPPGVVAPATSAANPVAVKADAARDEALKAGAETYAPTRLAIAGEKQGAASAALKQGDRATAEQRYAEAIATYGLAKTEALEQGRQADEARKTERQVADARRAAESAGGPKATASWNKAAMAQARGEEALKTRAFDRAMTWFAEARQAYEESARGGAPAPTPSAVAGRAEKDRQDAENAERAAMAARRDAEQAKASSLARQAFNSAQAREADGEAALKSQQFASARRSFLDAQDGFKRATQEAQQVQAQKALAQATAERTRAEAADKARAEAAEKARVEAAEKARAEGAEKARTEGAEKARTEAAEKARTEAAEKARTEAAEKARTEAAERARAEAAEKARAEAAEKARTEAAEKARAEAAERARAEAAAEKARAEGVEANRQRELVALNAARQKVEQVRGRMANLRDNAMKADAPKLAKPIFDAAEKRQSEADALVGKNPSEAGQRFGDAADLYLEARVKAESVTAARKQADSAKTQMLSEKQKASTSAPEYAEAQSEERQANALYDKSLYNDAAEKYRATATLYSKATKSAAVPKSSATPQTPTRRPPPPSF